MQDFSWDLLPCDSSRSCSGSFNKVKEEKPRVGFQDLSLLNRGNFPLGDLSLFWLNFQILWCPEMVKITNNTVKKWVQDLYRHFAKEDIHVAKRHMKRCSTSCIIRETPIETTTQCHLTAVRMAIIKKSANNKRWRGYGEKRSYAVCGNIT